MMQLTQRRTWKVLEKHAQTLQYQCALQTHNSAVIRTDAITLDYSSQAVDSTALTLLYQLAQECQLPDLIIQLMNGAPVNGQDSALHTLLRNSDPDPVWINQQDCKQMIGAVREEMRLISEKIRTGQWLGRSGKPIKDIVNLGIGGSMLGPQFCLDALSDYGIKTLGFHFISDFDDAACQRVLRQLDPETTLFIVSSKSFATTETLWNANKVMAWGGYANYGPEHFIAITACAHKAKAMGFQKVLPIWSWIGGRFSVCSAINLITCIAIGYEHFSEFLHGAAAMDTHFRSADIASNLPIMLALLGIWNNNNLKMQNLLILTYAKSLHWFVPYLQQLEMESNGKSIDKQGRDVNYATVPIIWGGSGNQAQHSYFQMLSQGTHRLSADLISIGSLDNRVIAQHKDALFWDDSSGNLNRYIPCNHIQLVDNSPYSIGSLIALYEHKVFSQAMIWNINPFDQPGVEHMKQKMEQWTTHAATAAEPLISTTHYEDLQ
jgi:glucose-6-phosphate isomerase